MKYREDNFEDPSLALLGRTKINERFRKRLLCENEEKNWALGPFNLFRIAGDNNSGSIYSRSPDLHPLFQIDVLRFQYRSSSELLPAPE